MSCTDLQQDCCKKIALRSYHGKYVAAKDDGSANADRDKRGPLDVFDVERISGNNIALKAAFNRKYLIAESANSEYEVNANSDSRGSNVELTIEPQKGNTYAFKTTHGRYLVAESDGRLRGDRTNVGIYEKFSIECIGKLQPHFPIKFLRVFYTNCIGIKVAFKVIDMRNFRILLSSKRVVYTFWILLSVRRL